MSEHGSRVGLGAVACGTLVALAVAGGLACAGAAAVASSEDLSYELALSQAALVGTSLSIFLGFAAFLGGRVTAVVCRALVRRDGAVAGLVTGSVLGLLLMAAGGGVAALWPARDAATLLGSVSAGVAIALLGGMLGGVSGARAEARAVGLRQVYVPKRTTAESYEREFFAEDSLSRPPG
jgi:hypothetical protein